MSAATPEEVTPCLDATASFAALPAELQQLALAFAEMAAATSAESRWHLRTAYGAREFGVTGDLVVRIPRRVNEHVVVKWVGGGLTCI